YQPEGTWGVTSSGSAPLARYVQAHGTHLYRRGLYGVINLTVPPPSMLSSDARNRGQCAAGRQRTNTPRQAPGLPTDPTVQDASGVLAGTLLAQKQLSERERITRAFRRILCRMPREKEMELLLEYYQQELQRYSAQPEKANAFLQAGEYPHRPGIDPVQQAALMSLIHGIYNLEETITRS